MKRAVLAVTEDGIKLGMKIQDACPCHLYTLNKYISTSSPGLLPIEGTIKDFMGCIFKEYKEIVMIMSCGIAVRSIAPWLSSKLIDPAVIACDDSGKYVISLVSGHIGGANRVTEEIATIIDGQAIITTASDNRNIESVDMLGKRLGLHIDNYEAAKHVTSCLINRRAVGYIDEYDILKSVESIDGTEEALIYIGNKQRPDIDVHNKFIVKLTRKCLIMGVGCKKATEPERLISAVNNILNEYNLSPMAIKAIATIDLKGEEPAIVELAKYYKVDLITVAKEEIEKIEDKFDNSAFVKKSIGVGCVCEPSAYITSKYGKRIVPKVKAGGITVSIYEAQDMEVRYEE